MTTTAEHCNFPYIGVQKAGKMLVKSHWRGPRFRWPGWCMRIAKKSVGGKTLSSSLEFPEMGGKMFWIFPF